MLCIYSTNLSNISCIIFQKSWWKYIFFQSLYQTREDILYVIHISSCISRATICAKISKILKISNFSQLHLISKLIPQSSLIYFPPTVSHKSSRYISRATSPVLSFFFFFFFYIQIYDSYSPTRFTISTHLFPHIFVTNACDFPELIDNIYANSFVTKIP